MALIVIGSLLISAKGILAKLLYAEGVSADQLVTIRAMLSLPLFWLWAIKRMGLINLLHVNQQALFFSVIAGFVCYYIGARIDFYALTLIDASLERVLLYTYPALVVIATAINLKSLPEPRVIMVLLLTYTGVIFAVGGFNIELLQANLYGAGLVMVCALTFTFYFLINDHVGNQIGSAGFTVYAMTAATVALSIDFFSGQPVAPFTLTPHAWQLLIFMIFFVTVIPVFMIAEGIKRIGAQRAALISTIGPPSTILLAVLILDETMQYSQLGGVVLILAGIILLEMNQQVRTPVPD